MTVPVATADPAAPADPAATPVPVPAPVLPADPAPVTDAALTPAPVADPAAAVTPPDGIQHLPSPDSLPPGTTQQAPDHPTTGLLRDIWHALRDGEMTGPDALKLLASTRPVDQDKLAASTPSNHGVPTAPPPAAPATPAPDVPPAPAVPVLLPVPGAPVPAS